METALAVAATLVGIAIVFALYWGILCLVYREKPRADEIHMVTTGDLWQIRLCRYRNKGGSGEPVLLCHGLMANQFNFTSPKDACLVDTLTANGYDCWLLDNRGNRSSIPAFGQRRHGACLDDVLKQDIPSAIGFIREQTGFGRVHWVGHSMGGMLMYAYELLFGRNLLASGCALGSPPGFRYIHFHPSKWLLYFAWVTPRIANILLRSGMPLLGIYKLLSRRGLQFFPTNWENVHPDVTAAAFWNMLEAPAPQIVQQISMWAEFKAWVMDNGNLDVGAGLRRLKTPLFLIYGASDPLVPVEAGESFFRSLSHDDKRILVLKRGEQAAMNYSHVDLAFGINGVHEVYVPIVGWMKRHPITESSEEVHVATQAEMEQDRVTDAHAASLYRRSIEASKAAHERSRELEQPGQPHAVGVQSRMAARTAAIQRSKSAAVTTPLRKAKTSNKKKTAKKKAPTKKKAVAARKSTPKKKTAPKAKTAPKKKPVAKKKTAAKKKPTPKKKAAKRKKAASGRR